MMEKIICGAKAPERREFFSKIRAPGTRRKRKMGKSIVCEEFRRVTGKRLAFHQRGGNARKPTWMAATGSWKGGRHMITGEHERPWFRQWLGLGGKGFQAREKKYLGK